MTYRYCCLAAGRKLPADREIAWHNIERVVPCDALGNEIVCQSELEELKLWTMQVVSYEIRDSVMYATLGERK